MGESPDDRRKKLSVISGGLDGMPKTAQTPDGNIDYGAMDIVGAHLLTAERIRLAYEAMFGGDDTTTAEMGPDTEEAELVHAMSAWENDPQTADLPRAYRCAKEYVRRVEAGSIAR